MKRMVTIVLSVLTIMTSVAPVGAAEFATKTTERISTEITQNLEVGQDCNINDGKAGKITKIYQDGTFEVKEITGTYAAKKHTHRVKGTHTESTIKKVNTKDVCCKLSVTIYGTCTICGDKVIVSVKDTPQPHKYNSLGKCMNCGRRK